MAQAPADAFLGCPRGLFLYILKIMKVLIIGGGGREHAIAWKLALSPSVSAIYIAPGNACTFYNPKCRTLALDGAIDSKAGIKELIERAKIKEIGLTVVGPEAPLAVGIVDAFRAAGLAIVGPDKNAARLEASKVFSKDFMEKHGVRTARAITVDSFAEAKKIAEAHFLEEGALPLVIKADGLAAGKGVIIAEDLKTALEGLEGFLSTGTLGAAGKTVLIEDYLAGPEVSVLAAVSLSPEIGERSAILPFVSARDHKRRFDGAEGPNTGGMGAIAPVPDFSSELEADFIENILKPTQKGLLSEGFDYRGFIFFGLIIAEGRCFLLEYNVRLGDPETQAVLPLMDSDFFALLEAMLSGELDSFPLSWKKAHSSAPVMVADGYPSEYRSGDRIEIDSAMLEKAGAQVFFAGTSVKAGELFTSGGRVLSVQALADSPKEAQKKAYTGLSAVEFKGMGFRKDIGSEGVSS